MELASAGDLALRWRPLSNEEMGRASALLSDASSMVRRLWPDVDSRITAGSLDPGSVLWVLCNMVRRAMSQAVPGVQSRTEQRGPFSETVRYTNPDGGLYLTEDEHAVFGDSDVTATARSVWMC